MKKSLTIAIVFLVVAMLAPAAHADGIKQITMEDTMTKALDPAVNADGGFVAFQGARRDLDPNLNVFVHDIRAQTNPLVSHHAFGPKPNHSSGAPAISKNGRYVAFQSDASNLLPVNQDTNKKTDVFVRDLLLGTTERVSVRVDGGTVVEANGVSEAPAISADGRYVAFASVATNLLPNWEDPNAPNCRHGEDSNCSKDVFVYDRDDDKIERVSVGAGGSQLDGASSAPAISGDGLIVAFQSVASQSGASNLPGPPDGGSADVFVRDRRGTGTTKHVSVALPGLSDDGPSIKPSISQNGRWVSFQSAATNLVDADENEDDDVFVRDLSGGTTERVSVTSTGGEALGAGFWDVNSTPAISPDGRFVAFVSVATNILDDTDTDGLFDVFLHDRAATTNVTSLASAGNEFEFRHAHRPTISTDGLVLVFDSQVKVGGNWSPPSVFLSLRDPEGPAGLINDLKWRTYKMLDLPEQCVDSSGNPCELWPSLSGTLDSALAHLAEGNVAGACADLGDYHRAVKTSEGAFTWDEMEELIGRSEVIRGELGCP